MDEKRCFIRHTVAVGHNQGFWIHVSLVAIGVVTKNPKKRGASSSSDAHFDAEYAYRFSLLSRDFSEVISDTSAQLAICFLLFCFLKELARPLGVYKYSTSL